METSAVTSAMMNMDLKQIPSGSRVKNNVAYSLFS